MNDPKKPPMSPFMKLEPVSDEIKNLPVEIAKRIVEAKKKSQAENAGEKPEPN